jgi:antitoxin ChpS
MVQSVIHPRIQKATHAFKRKLAQHFDVSQAILFGSTARHTANEESDADVAVLLNGQVGKFIDTKFAMDDLAYEVLLDTGVRIQPLPIWLTEWQHPERYSNPGLLLNIQKDGVVL